MTRKEQLKQAYDNATEVHSELEQLGYIVDDLSREAEDQQCDDELVRDLENLADTVWSLTYRAASVCDDLHGFVPDADED